MRQYEMRQFKHIAVYSNQFNQFIRHNDLFILHTNQYFTNFTISIISTFSP